MVQKTTPSLLALVGRIQNFIAKTPEAPPSKGAGSFTRPSLLALSGRLLSFDPKTPEIGGEKGEGLFTGPSLLALSGRRQTFLPKSIVEVAPPTRRQYYILRHTSCGFWREYITVEE